MDCRPATDILLELRTDVNCRDVKETAIAVGAPADVETRPFATSTKGCDPATGRIGSLALTPRSEEDAQVAVRVVTGLGKTAAECVRDGYQGGCIVARRTFKYVPRQSVDVPIEMQASCRDTPCKAAETCWRGGCVPAELEEPAKCTDPGGCDISAGGRPGGAGAGGQANAVPTEGGEGGEAGHAGGAPMSDAGAAGAPPECNLPCPVEAPVCEDGECRARCDLSGTFALKITVRATWAGGTYVQSGSGSFGFWMKLTGTHTDGQFRGELTECGRVGPDIHSAAVNETYRLTYPEPLFDATPPLLTPMPVVLSVGDASATLEAPPMALILGTRLANPTEEAWPDSAEALSPVDTDRDGKPGISAVYRNDNGYDYPHPSPLSVDRVERVYVASRLVFSFDGPLSSCASSFGEATVTALDSRIFGCRLLSSTRDCDATEANFIDSNAIQPRPTAATYELTKIADGATCADIRSRP